MSEKEIKEKLNRIPKTREGRMASILATIRSRPEGLNIQDSINLFSVNFGVTRQKVIEYYKQMDRARLIKVGDTRVYAREK